MIKQKGGVEEMSEAKISLEDLRWIVENLTTDQHHPYSEAAKNERTLLRYGKIEGGNKALTDLLSAVEKHIAGKGEGG